MIKKITIMSSLISSLLLADGLKEKGFFAGLDLSRVHSKIEYKNSSTLTSNPYVNSDYTNPISLKLGYQYYFTKIYARINSSSVIDDRTKDRYKIKTHVIEFNTDYIPILYTNENKDWAIKGVLGVAVGVNSSKFNEYNGQQLFAPMNDENGTVSTNTQYKMNLGYNLGLITEWDSGVSAELGYRFRSGLALEYFDNDNSGNRLNEATFKLLSQEIYLGVNYLF